MRNRYSSLDPRYYLPLKYVESLYPLFCCDQEYDPDMPPELAAAAGMHDSAENVDATRADGGLGDLAKASARVRPPLVCSASFLFHFHVPYSCAQWLSPFFLSANRQSHTSRNWLWRALTLC